MAYTDIQICNLALTHLGDIATVASISAPTTAQERYCATFYPMARDILLEKHHWGFATTRATLVASAVAPPSTWQYAYDAPASVINYISVLDSSANDDYSTALNFNTVGAYTMPVANLGAYTPQAYAVEKQASGADIIYCNLSAAVLRYTVAITDPAVFPATFIDALAYRLAAMLAGPILKGDVGAKMSQMLEQLADKKMIEAEGSDSNQRSIKPAPGAPWMQGRG